MHPTTRNKDGESLYDEAVTVGRAGHAKMAARIFFLLAWRKLMALIKTLCSFFAYFPYFENIE
jgi:hypothetical protein